MPTRGIASFHFVSRISNSAIGRRRGNANGEALEGWDFLPNKKQCWRILKIAIVQRRGNPNGVALEGWDYLMRFT